MIKYDIISLEEYREEYNKLAKGMHPVILRERKYTLSLDAFSNLGVATWPDVGANIRKWTGLLPNLPPYDEFGGEWRERVKAALRAFVDSESKMKEYISVE